METLDKSDWDVLIAGTGLHQSLLALALSRSGKKVLHVDKNGYYGGSETAFSTQEAEEWAQQVNSIETAPGTLAPLFSNASVRRPSGDAVAEGEPKLSFPRAYSLSLSPQIIYSLSDILPALVASKVYRQLEFLANGGWWVYSKTPGSEEEDPVLGLSSSLSKVPGSREDIFADSTLQPRAKRALMKFLRFLVNFEEEELWEANRGKPFLEFLSEAFSIPPAVFDATFALTLSSDIPASTTTEYALPRIARHLRSIGVFGPGFGSVVPKWGGLSEMTQVACRAGAVGGGIYVLGQGLAEKLEKTEAATPAEATTEPDLKSKGQRALSFRLTGGDTVSTDWLAGSIDDLTVLPSLPVEENRDTSAMTTVSRSITIVSSSLDPLFPQPAEGAPAPAGAVINFPADSLCEKSKLSSHPPINIFVHSSETGECPTGQCVLYAHIAAAGEEGFALLEAAVESLLASVLVQPAPKLLWSLKYEQHHSPLSETPSKGASYPLGNILVFPRPSLDLAFDDSVLERVKTAWQKIMGDDAGQFLVFEDRGEEADED